MTFPVLSNLEVDIVSVVAGETVPFEVKYAGSIQGDDLKGIRLFCEAHKLRRADVITREISDFRVVKSSAGTEILQIPAVLACYWLSKSELSYHELPRWGYFFAKLRDPANPSGPPKSSVRFGFQVAAQAFQSLEAVKSR